jgi:hypothetical protein
MENTEMMDKLMRLASDAGHIGRENYGEDIGRLGTAVADLADLVLALAQKVTG